MKTNRSTLKTRDTSVMAGIDKHITASITIDGTSYTPAELKARFQAQITGLDANDALRKSLTDGVQNAKVTVRDVGNLYYLLRATLIGQYGRNANAILNDFGMTTPKTFGPKTVAAKAVAAAKRQATRAARHTMGSVQKKEVTGNVVRIETTPVVAGPPVPAPKPAEAPDAPAPADDRH
jgi:hypothetical protein